MNEFIPLEVMTTNRLISASFIFISFDLFVTAIVVVMELNLND